MGPRFFGRLPAERLSLYSTTELLTLQGNSRVHVLDLLTASGRTAMPLQERPDVGEESLVDSLAQSAPDRMKERRTRTTVMRNRVSGAVLVDLISAVVTSPDGRGHHQSGTPLILGGTGAPPSTVRVIGPDGRRAMSVLSSPGSICFKNALNV